MHLGTGTMIIRFVPIMTIKADKDRHASFLACLWRRRGAAEEASADVGARRKQTHQKEALQTVHNLIGALQHIEEERDTRKDIASCMLAHIQSTSDHKKTEGKIEEKEQ